MNSWNSHFYHPVSQIIKWNGGSSLLWDWMGVVIMYVSASNSYWQLEISSDYMPWGRAMSLKHVPLGLLAINMSVTLHTLISTTFSLIQLKDTLHSECCSLNNLTSMMFAGVLIVLGLGTALRLALECCQEWGSRRNVGNMPRLENIPPTGYHPAVV
jgi:hypothetical protein